MNPFAQFFDRLRKGFETLTPVRKMTMAMAAFLTLAGIAALVFLANSIEYRVLFSNLSSEDAGLIVSRLQEKKIPYKLSAGGDTVSVPDEKVSELRLEMAASGLPKGGGVGFEIFDVKTLGSTEFEQQLNYRRALQGELSRTINGLDEIQQCRVHIALPKDSLFISEQKKPTASVTLKLKSGKSLRPAQIEGIAHLVASSVEGLTPDNVMIVDSRGAILSRNNADTKLSKLSNSQVEYQRNVEKDLANQIQSMLENVVGQGKAVVRVAADFNFQVTEKTEETFDAEAPAVRSVRRQSEKTTPPAPGEKAKSTDAAGAGEHEKLDEVINYELNRIVNKTVMPVGEIRKISIAVLVDGTYTKNEKGVEVYKPRDKKEMDGLEELVRKSAGFNAARGDQVAISNIAFKKDDDQEPAGQSWTGWVTGFTPVIKYATILAVAALLLFFVIRPLVRLLLTREPYPAQLGAAQLGGAGDAAERLPGGSAPLALESIDDKTLTETDLARQLAKADAKRFAELLRNWLK
ncbi:MAG: Flagellar M-ring protein [Syntrophaceae bacterium PtaU1.Bin231]|nr:MAG: Flagellar M-ring protein [Syntrophaceae bacterium PtaU1.Bin231]HOG16739.1 flagellar basal-body MS-ring/collar protein FliF [Syntrophales bacterium]